MSQEQSQFLRIKKLIGRGIIQVAARHNHREIVAEMGADADGPIDPRRSHTNVVLHGPQTAQEVASAAQAMLDDANVKPLRKDAVQALEIIFGLPPASGLDELAFFQSAVAWARRYFAAPVISAIVHNDEAAPHCHVLILPLVDEKMNGSDMMGSRAKLLAMRASFHAQVAQHFGLAKPATQRRASAADRRSAAGCALDAIKSNLTLLNDLAVAGALLDLIAADPTRLLAALDVDTPKVRPKRGQAKTFAAQMTKPCKPESANPNRVHQDRTLIGFADSDQGEKHRTLSCVGFADSPALIPAPGPQPTADTSADTDAAGEVRERDDDMPVDCWNADIGQMVGPRPASSRRMLADASVRAILERHTEPETRPYALQAVAVRVASPLQPAGP